MMPTSVIAIILALATTMTASAHIWNRPELGQTAAQDIFRTNPCPGHYRFQKGFCPPLQRISTAQNRDETQPAHANAARKTWFERAVGKILDGSHETAANSKATIYSNASGRE